LMKTPQPSYHADNHLACMDSRSNTQMCHSTFSCTKEVAFTSPTHNEKSVSRHATILGSCLLSGVNLQVLT
jgi:hypothetical protein